MATARRTANSDLNPACLPEPLTREPHRFAFFQAVRLLQQHMPGAARVGGYGSPAREAIRFRANPSIAFPASEIQALECSLPPPLEMVVNFMGLTGPLGVLPLHFTELLQERIRARDTALRDFLDIFNHRLISLFYLAWEKYKPVATSEHGDDRFHEFLYCFLGLGTPGLRRPGAIPDESRLFHGGPLTMHTRPAEVLQSLLRDYFEAPVELEQFVGAWRKIEADALCHLGHEQNCESLGVGVVIGDEIWDAQSGLRIRLGPLRLEQYQAFLPGSSGVGQLRAWISYFTGLEFSVELQLILRREEVPSCELGRAASAGPQLGWTTWIKSAAFRRDPADLVFEVI